MEKTAKIYIAGHRGLAGSALMRQLRARGYTNLVTRTHGELDLTEAAATEAFFAAEKPDYVFLGAARAGGIHANNTYPAEFIYDNITIAANTIHAAWRHNVKRLLFLGSSCVYPRLAPQPLKEEYLLSGPLESTNRAYALAKIAGIEICWSYNRQYGTRYLAAMPTNLYGPGDNYHPQDSHVIPALIRKFHEAKTSGAKSVAVWGTGSPLREFLYSDDMADACVFLMNLPDARFIPLLSQDNAERPPLVNIGVGRDISVKELAEVIKTVTEFQGNIVFDPSMPDGVPRKLLDVSRMNALGWRAHTPLEAGLRTALADFIRHNG